MRLSFPIGLSRQVSQHGLAGFFGLSQRFKGRAGHPDGARILRERAPRCHVAGRSVKAGTAAVLITDHERKAVAARVPYFHILDWTNDAGELHSHYTAVATLDTHHTQARPHCDSPSQINGPSSGKSRGRWAVVPGGPKHNGAKLARSRFVPAGSSGLTRSDTLIIGRVRRPNSGRGICQRRPFRFSFLSLRPRPKALSLKALLKSTRNGAGPSNGSSARFRGKRVAERLPGDVCQRPPIRRSSVSGCL